METPYFVIDESALKRNIRVIQEALDNWWPRSILSYSVKTNSLPWVLKYMKQVGAYAEAVSDEEFQLSQKCGYSLDKIIFNGPIKSPGMLDKAFSDGTIINLDSKSDLQRLVERNPANCSRIGIRVNVEVEGFQEDDIGTEEKKHGFRFGFSDTVDLEAVICLMRKIYGQNCRFGLHFHCNSETRSVTVYEGICRYAKKIIRKYSLRPSFVDIGGGFCGGVEGRPDARQYLQTISRELSSAVDKHETTLIVEPGSAIVTSAVDYHTCVVDVKRTKYCVVATTDGSRVHIDPLWKKNDYFKSIIRHNDLGSEESLQMVCGYTCMDRDRIFFLKNQPILSAGDEIVYHRLGGYTMTYGGTFIRYFPEVYVRKTNSAMELIRKRMNVNEYYNIQTI